MLPGEIAAPPAGWDISLFGTLKDVPASSYFGDNAGYNDIWE
jgi:hypothetical protein